MANKNLLIDQQNYIDDTDYDYSDHDCTMSPDDGCRVCFARAITKSRQGGDRHE